jgi:uncharacterized protein Usg
MASLDLQLKGFRLTTALITYRLPDHPTLLQEYLWQDLDKVPKFPILNRFLSFWEDNIEGKLVSVEVSSSQLIRPAVISSVDEEFQIH